MRKDITYMKTSAGLFQRCLNATILQLQQLVGEPTNNQALAHRYGTSPENLSRWRNGKVKNEGADILVQMLTELPEEQVKTALASAKPEAPSIPPKGMIDPEFRLFSAEDHAPGDIFLGGIKLARHKPIMVLGDTGSGKTRCVIAPLLRNILETHTEESGVYAKVAGLVLDPTRELIPLIVSTFEKTKRPMSDLILVGEKLQIFELLGPTPNFEEVIIAGKVVVYIGAGGIPTKDDYERCKDLKKHFYQALLENKKDGPSRSTIMVDDEAGYWAGFCLEDTEMSKQSGSLRLTQIFGMQAIDDPRMKGLARQAGNLVFLKSNQNGAIIRELVEDPPTPSGFPSPSPSQGVVTARGFIWTCEGKHGLTNLRSAATGRLEACVGTGKEKRFVTLGDMETERADRFMAAAISTWITRDEWTSLNGLTAQEKEFVEIIKRIREQVAKDFPSATSDKTEAPYRMLGNKEGTGLPKTQEEFGEHNTLAWYVAAQNTTLYQMVRGHLTQEGGRLPADLVKALLGCTKAELKAVCERIIEAGGEEELPSKSRQDGKRQRKS
jgi:hypothetical protein